MSGILLAAAAAVALLWLYGLVQPLVFVGREWDLAAYRGGWSLEGFLAPWDGGLAGTPIALYNLLFAWKGLLTYNHYAAMLVVAHVGAAVVVGAVAHMRGGPLVGIAASVALLVLGAAADVLLWPVNVGVPIAVAAGAVAWGAWFPTVRSWPYRWLGAVALVVAVTAHPIGITFLLATGVRAAVVKPRDRVVLAWVATALVLLAGWVAVYGRDEIVPNDVFELLVAWPLAVRDGLSAAVGSLGLVGAELGLLLAVVLAALLGIAVGRGHRPGWAAGICIGSAAGVFLLAGAIDGAPAIDGALIYASSAWLVLAAAEVARSVDWSRADRRWRVVAAACVAAWIAWYGVSGVATLDREAAAWRERADDVRAMLIVMQLYPELVEARQGQLIDRATFGGITFAEWLEVDARLGSAVPGLADSITRRGDAVRLAADRHLSHLAAPQLEAAYASRGPDAGEVLEANFTAAGGAALVDRAPEGCGRFHVGGDDPHVILALAPGERLAFRTDGRLETQVFHAMFGTGHQEAASSRQILEPDSWYVIDPPPAPDGHSWRMRVDPPQDAVRAELCLLGSQPEPPVELELAPHAGGLDDPVGLAHAGDGSGRLFVIERSGTIRVIDEGRVLPAPFLDIAARVTSGGEQGLLGLAFHPDFPSDPRVFVTYVDLDGDVRLSEFPALDGERADPDSETVLLTIAQPTDQHNGGMIAFGPDGLLYVSSGDGTFHRSTGQAGTGQEPHTWLGVILRIDVDRQGGARPYAIPDDNPRIDGRISEVWSYGLRNPWRFSFDRRTGDLWIADVGQRDREEINFQPADSSGGENYGWAVMEGTACYFDATCDTDGLVPPVAEYRHHGGNCAVVGGYVYRGRAHRELTGRYLFGDFCSGTVWAMDGPHADPIAVASTGRIISSFGEDEDGELYVAAIYDGAILRIATKER